MPQNLARLDFAGPKVTFTVGGSKASLEFEGILDTGFTGFILLPISLAIPLGLAISHLPRRRRLSSELSRSTPQSSSPTMATKSCSG